MVKFKNWLLAIGFLFAAGLLAWFYFIPAFRGNIVVSPDLSVGPVSLHWYGLMTAAGILAGFMCAYRLAERRDIIPERLVAALPWIVFAGFVGARLYYVAFFWPYFRENPQDIIAFWKGGISIYGALAGSAVAIAYFAKKHSFSAAAFFDLAAVGAALGQSIGRFGNFFNQEAFGRPTSLPWGLFVRPDSRPAEFLNSAFFHPTFLYESLWDFSVFLVLVYLSRKTKTKGVLAGFYLILYGLGRFFIESIRLDSFFLFSVRVDQVVSLLAMMLGAIIIFLRINYADKENN